MFLIFNFLISFLSLSLTLAVLCLVNLYFLFHQFNVMMQIIDLNFILLTLLLLFVKLLIHIVL